MSESIVRLKISFQASDMKAVDLDKFTKDLLQEIKEQEVSSASLISVAETPMGSEKASFGGFVLGALKTQVKTANLKGVLSYLRDKLTDQPIELEVESKGKRLILAANNQKDFYEAMEKAQKFVEDNEK
ncbi:MAG: hypothetical protein AAF378_07940 [Cyanobacteria bacterium P01_A01_bin.84]